MESEQKKFILQNQGKLTVQQMAQQLGIKERKVKKILEREKSRANTLKTGIKSTETTSSFLTLPFVFGFLFLLAFLIYSNTLQADFQFDDRTRITAITNIHGWGDLDLLWANYKTRFLTYLSLAFNVWMTGMSSSGFHILNTLIHFFCSITVFAWVRQIFKTPAMAASPLKPQASFIALASALIFLAHPIQTQAVSYIIQRATSLATLFYLLAFLFYTKARLEQKIIFHVLALLATMAAMFSKEIAFTLPIVLLLYEWIFLSDSRGPKRFAGLAPYLLTLLVVPALRGITVQALGADVSSGLAKEVATISRTEYLFTQFNVIRTYLRLLFLPFQQNLDYDYPVSHHFFEPVTLLSFLFLTALILFAAKIFKQQKLLAFCIFWFFLTLSVESSIIPIRDVIFEHRLYLPMFGFSLFLAVAIVSLAKAPRIYVPALTAIVIIFSFLTYKRNFVWKDGVSLWTDVIAKSPRKARGYNGLAATYLDKKDYDKALEFGSKAVEVNPQYGNAYYNLGVAYEAKGMEDKTIESFKKAIEFEPAYTKAYVNLGVAYGKKGAYDEAIRYLETAVKTDPNYPEAHHNLGVAYNLKGMKEKARQELEQLVRLNRNDLAEKLQEDINSV